MGNTGRGGRRITLRRCRVLRSSPAAAVAAALAAAVPGCREAGTRAAVSPQADLRLFASASHPGLVQALPPRAALGEALAQRPPPPPRLSRAPTGADGHRRLGEHCGAKRLKRPFALSLKRLPELHDGRRDAGLGARPLAAASSSRTTRAPAASPSTPRKYFLLNHPIPFLLPASTRRWEAAGAEPPARRCRARCRRREGAQRRPARRCYTVSCWIIQRVI